MLKHIYGNSNVVEARKRLHKNIVALSNFLAQLKNAE
jgi:hypothetical protein